MIFILVDDLGWTDLSSYGSDYYQTPNIDKLASEGVKFTNAYAASAVCSPTRASILTGKYPARLQLTDFIPGKHAPNTKLLPPDWKKYLDTSEVTMVKIFQSNGYKTAHIGKWHLGKDSIYWPENQGFDVNIAGWSRGQPFKNKKKGKNGYFAPYGNPRLTDGPQKEYLTNRLAQEAKQFIEQHKNQPFFLNYWLYAVHTPLQATAEKVHKYKQLQDSTSHHKNPTYAAMIEHMDEAVGTILTTLKELDLEKNTIIVFTSDNGGLIGNHPRFKEKVTSNIPLKSGKGDRYEGGVRVPTIVYYPEKIKPSIEHTPTISVDFLPTLLDIANIPKKNLPETDGVSLASILLNQKDMASRPLFWHYPHYHTEGAVPHSAIRFNQYKLIHNLETNELELYDLSQDMGETHNLSSQNKEITNRLFKMLQEWKMAVGAQNPTINPSFFDYEKHLSLQN
ncbi:arylsulfatase A-like enzyme [Kordia periserrulae]|uniref:Arylsulfatase A-like enzyme n=1 Tax=Kordia periserrulae TaxID=701523 RepID=A0A2T6BUD8_9FLAO|nr:sulfatase [Kordia periserrulae]PTX59691.1 arylsulfatase A-like enzyme [Kordia periserrulae]